MTKKMDMEGKFDPKTSSESFKEPRTIPKNWDVSTFDSQVTSSTTISGNSAGELETPAATGSNDSEGTNTAFDPFPQPRTVPGNWDVSDLI
jgi:hypothetical protein